MRCFPEPDCKNRFFSALREGKVVFQISGEAVVCLHDKHENLLKTEEDPDRSHLRHHVLTTPTILQTLQRSIEQELPEYERLGDIHWYGDTPRPNPIPPSGANYPQKPTESSDKICGNINNEQPCLSDVSADKENTVGEHDGTTKDEIRSEQDQSSVNVTTKPQFLPPQVYEVLLEMQSREHGAIDDENSLQWAENISLQTQRSLSSFEMQAEFAEPKFRLTPNGVLIAFYGHHTLTVDKIKKKTSEMLTTYGIEVTDVRPGKGRISVFVKREERSRVPLASTWLNASWPDCAPGSWTSFILGAREDSDRLLYLNLTDPYSGYNMHGPHTLIAGETGSGKGILTQVLLLQLIAFNDPKDAELILVDPKKGVDFTWLDGAPQMKKPIISEVSDAQKIFADLVHEMNQRYEKLVERKAPNIAEYNRKVLPEERMSQIFLVHDELGAWMAQDKKYQEVVLSSVSSLAMKARAAGIHLVLITQRADVDAVPGRLRDNMGNRLCLKVQNATGSKMVLDVGGAEKLLGKGHLSCVLANQSAPVGQDFFVVQVPFAEPNDMHRLANAAKAYWEQRKG